MPYSISVSDSQGALWLVFSGEHDSDQALAGCKAAAHLARNRGIVRIFADIRDTDIQATTLDIFNVHETIPKLFDPACRIAALYTPSAATRDETITFAEDVTTNRGLHLRFFTSLSDAETWLLS